MRSSNLNILSTRKGGLRTGKQTISIAPVTIIYVQPKSRFSETALSAEHIAGQAVAALNKEDYARAGQLFGKACKALPDRMLDKHRRFHREWARKQRLCEQWGVIQNVRGVA